jgi:hypothetical protein
MFEFLSCIGGASTAAAQSQSQLNQQMNSQYQYNQLGNYQQNYNALGVPVQAQYNASYYNSSNYAAEETAYKRGIEQVCAMTGVNPDKFIHM